MIHRFLNICKGGQGAQNSDTAWYYCSGEAHRTRDGALEARRYLGNVVATVEVVFEEEDAGGGLSPQEVINLACPYCASGDVPKKREDTGEWQHGSMVGLQEVGKPVAVNIKYCLATHLRNSIEFKGLLNG